MATEENIRMVMYGVAWCPDVALARRMLDRHGVPYEYHDIDAEPEAKAALLALSGEDWLVPTLVLSDGTVLSNPSPRELRNLINLQCKG